MLSLKLWQQWSNNEEQFWPKWVPWFNCLVWLVLEKKDSGYSRECGFRVCMSPVLYFQRSKYTSFVIFQGLCFFLDLRPCSFSNESKHRFFKRIVSVYSSGSVYMHESKITSKNNGNSKQLLKRKYRNSLRNWSAAAQTYLLDSKA